MALARLEAIRRRKAIAENIALHGDLVARDKKIRRLVDANIVGIIIWEVEGRILEANDEFLRMVGYDREDLAAGRLHRTTLTPPEWRDRDARTVAELKTDRDCPTIREGVLAERRKPRAGADRRGDVRGRYRVKVLALCSI